MVKKIYASMTGVYVTLFGCLIFLFFTILCISVIIFETIVNELNFLWIDFVFVAFFSFCVSACVFFLNRCGCQVIYDSGEDVITRRGFICGFGYQLKVEDIKEIISVQPPRSGVVYILVDSSKTEYDGFLKYSGLSKKSFIQIDKNDKSKEFIEQFWDKPIKDMQYVDLFRK